MTSQCQRDTCHEAAHVVLFATGPFDGQHHHPGTMVAYCLRHGGDLYDALRLWGLTRSAPGSHPAGPGKVARWLDPVAYGTVPRTRLAHHTTATPAERPRIAPWTRQNTERRARRTERQNDR